MTSVTVYDKKNKEDIIKPISKLSANELFYNSFVNNYLLAPGEDVGFQPVVYSEKPNISNIWTKKKSLANLIKPSNSTIPTSLESLTSQNILEYLYKSNQNIATEIGKNIINDINILLGSPKVDTLLGTTAKIYNSFYDEVIDAFARLTNEYQNNEYGKGSDKISKRISEVLKVNPKFEFIEEIHYSLDRDGNAIINPNLLHFFEMYLSDSDIHFKDYINIQLSLTAYDLNKTRFSVRDLDNKQKPIIRSSQDHTKSYLRTKLGDVWYNAKTSEHLMYKIENEAEFTIENILNPEITTNAQLHPELEKFILLDIIISSHFNGATIGNSFIHNAKVKNRAMSEDLLEGFKTNSVNYSNIANFENVQTIAMYKRAVGYTANMFTFARGLDTGVPDNLRIAIIEDPQEMVVNAQNTSDKVDIHDGAIFFPAFVNKMIATSLGELTVNEKHFKPFMIIPHNKYGVSTEIKSAAFTINNYTIRESVNSSEKYDSVLRKMTDFKFTDDYKLKLSKNDFEGVSSLEKIWWRYFSWRRTKRSYINTYQDYHRY